MPNQSKITPENARNMRRKIAPCHYFYLNRLKVTHPRAAILGLFQKSRDPVCAESILHDLPDIHISVLYNTLKILLRIDLIERVDTPTDIIERDRVFILYGKKAPRKRAYYQFK